MIASITDHIPSEGSNTTSAGSVSNHLTDALYHPQTHSQVLQQPNQSATSSTIGEISSTGQLMAIHTNGSYLLGQGSQPLHYIGETGHLLEHSHHLTSTSHLASHQNPHHFFNNSPSHHHDHSVLLEPPHHAHSHAHSHHLNPHSHAGHAHQQQHGGYDLSHETGNPAYSSVVVKTEYNDETEYMECPPQNLSGEGPYSYATPTLVPSGELDLSMAPTASQQQLYTLVSTPTSGSDSTAEQQFFTALIGGGISQIPSPGGAGHRNRSASMLVQPTVSTESPPPKRARCGTTATSTFHLQSHLPTHLQQQQGQQHQLLHQHELLSHLPFDLLDDGGGGGTGPTGSESSATSKSYYTYEHNSQNSVWHTSMLNSSSATAGGAHSSVLQPLSPRMIKKEIDNSVDNLTNIVELKEANSGETATAQDS